MPAKINASAMVAIFIAACIGAVALVSWRWRLLLSHNWGLFTMVLIIATLIFFLFGFERGPASTREIGVIAVLATVAAVARIPFTAIPSVQPVTFLVIVSGFVFGARAGFMVGATAALVSNFFLGQGPWTPIQMLLWGLVGASSGWLGLAFPQLGRGWMAGFGLLWGYLFGWLTNLWFWTSFVQPLTLKSLLMTYAASFLFDTCHALSNVGFYLIFGPRVIRVLRRFQRKLSYTVDRDSGTAATPAVAQQHR